VSTKILNRKNDNKSEERNDRSSESTLKGEDVNGGEKRGESGFIQICAIMYGKFLDTHLVDSKDYWCALQCVCTALFPLKTELS
jgi:hypothetical protein